jgi:hypothetical protein
MKSADPDDHEEGLLREYEYGEAAMGRAQRPAPGVVPVPVGRDRHRSILTLARSGGRAAPADAGADGGIDSCKVVTWPRDPPRPHATAEMREKLRELVPGFVS